MSKRYKIVAVNDEQDVCTICGKTNLKRVAWIVELDADGNAIGDAQAVGMDCAGRMMGWSSAKTRKQIDLQSDFEKLVEKLNRLVEKFGKEQVIDYVRRLHWHRIGKVYPTVDSMSLINWVDEQAVIVKIW